MKLGQVVFILSALLTGLGCWAEEVDLDRLESSDAESVQTPARSLVLTVYGDLDLTIDLAKPDLDRITTIGFIQNHRSVLVEANYKEQASMMTDIFNPSALFTMTLHGPESSLTFGMIPVPFGEFNFHHIYGGFEDERGDFLPKLWSDLGVSGQWRPVSGLTVEPYIVSGFSTRSGGKELSFQSPGADREQLAKAVGFRTQWSPAPGSFLTVSLFDQEFDQREFRGRNLLLAGLDGAARWGRLSVKGGAVVGLISNEITSFRRWADYGEVQWSLSPSVSLRARAGQMDPDERNVGPEDQADANIGVIWKGEVLEVDGIFFHHWSTAPGFQGTAGYNSDSIMVKVLMAL